MQKKQPFAPSLLPVQSSSRHIRCLPVSYSFFFSNKSETLHWSALLKQLAIFNVCLVHNLKDVQHKKPTLLNKLIHGRDIIKLIDFFQTCNLKQGLEVKEWSNPSNDV
jgi:hypothetical protein